MDIPQLEINWNLPKPDSFRVSFHITHPCGCTKNVQYDESIGNYVVEYTRPAISGECQGGGCCNHRGIAKLI